MLFAGIDWSDQALDYHLRDADGHVLTEGKVLIDAEGVGDLFSTLEAHGTPEQIGVAIETAHGAWLQAFLDRGYCMYPVNPKSVERFREALNSSGSKSDAIDRRVLAMFLVTFHKDLRPLRPDAPELVSLRVACQDRVRLVEECTAKNNELLAILKTYYPAFLGFFGKHGSLVALRFLQEFSTQDEMFGLSSRRLRGWLRRNKYPCEDRVENMVAALSQSVLPVAGHLQRAKAPLICYLAASITALKAELLERERAIAQQFEALPEAKVISSLPGAGQNLAPALLACFGRDKERFPTADAARAFMGTAPVTKASGRSRYVQFRRGCWKFARRTLQLFAEQSRRCCAWATRLYEKQRASGHSHHEALRAIAHKWVKIILAMKREETPYDEGTFLRGRHRHIGCTVTAEL